MAIEILPAHKRMVALYVGGLSIPEVSAATEIHKSTIRFRLLKYEVIRTRTEGIRNAAMKGLLGTGLKGKKIVFSQEWKDNIRKSKLIHGERKAKGVSLKPNGYVEITRGANKGRSQHRVVMEKFIGRPLLPSEVVHHKDHNRANNDIDNLELMDSREHLSMHAKENNQDRLRNNKGQYQ